MVVRYVSSWVYVGSIWVFWVCSYECFAVSNLYFKYLCAPEVIIFLASLIFMSGAVSSGYYEKSNLKFLASFCSILLNWVRTFRSFSWVIEFYILKLQTKLWGQLTLNLKSGKTFRRFAVISINNKSIDLENERARWNFHSCRFSNLNLCPAGHFHLRILRLRIDSWRLFVQLKVIAGLTQLFHSHSHSHFSTSISLVEAEAVEVCSN